MLTENEIIRALRDAENNAELDCELHELRPILLKAASFIEQQAERIGQLWAEQPIKCAECRHMSRERSCFGLYCLRNAIDVNADDFCSYGKRRETTDNAGH